VRGLIWLWPGVIASVLASLLLAAPLARLLSTTKPAAWVLLFSIGVIAAATLTPVRGPIGIDLSQVRPCDLERTWIASSADLGLITDVSLNITLFIPLGLAIALLPRSLRTLAVIAVAIALPFAIEGLQYLLPLLARGCQSGDVVDSLTGLVLGLASGILVRPVANRLARHVGFEGRTL